jgi:hypothetical protein
MFYADLEGAGHDEALAVLAARTPFMRRLGTYHSAVAVARSEEKA